MKKLTNTKNNIIYVVEESFIHHLSQVKMFRVKRIFESGGLDFVVYNSEQLQIMTGIIA